MSDNNNTSFAHAFLPGLILGLIIGAVAGAFVPEMMEGNKIKVDRSAVTQPTEPREGEYDREGHLIEDTEQDLDSDIEDHMNDAGEQVEDIIDNAEEAIDDATNTIENDLPTSP